MKMSMLILLSALQHLKFSEISTISTIIFTSAIVTHVHTVHCYAVVDVFEQDKE